MNKKKRQQLIEQAVVQQRVHNQADLVRLLEEQGYSVTQATISRDITEMQLIKVDDGQGSHYQLSAQQRLLESKHEFVDVISTANVKGKFQDKVISLSTVPGSGPVVAAAIKQFKWPEVFTVIADDDTVLIVLTEIVTEQNIIWQRVTGEMSGWLLD